MKPLSFYALPEERTVDNQASSIFGESFSKTGAFHRKTTAR